MRVPYFGLILIFKYMFVNSNDYNSEVEVLNSCIDLIPEISNRNLKHISSSSIYDFAGDQLKVDVKVENISSTQYPRYLLSKEKGDLVKNEPQCDYWIIYYFLGDYKIRAFDLSYTPLTLSVLNYTHARSQEKMSKEVYSVPSHAYRYEFDKIPYLNPIY